MPMHNKTPYWVLVLAGILLVGFVYQAGLYQKISVVPTPQKPSTAPIASESPQDQVYQSVAAAPDRGTVALRVGENVQQVEVVKTTDSITLGLSGRSEIGADGMLFVFQQAMMPRFWMKEMQFPLDIIWISSGKVVDITEQVPAPDPNTPLDELPTFAPRAPVEWVLEVPAGTAEKNSWKVGTNVTEIAPLVSE